MNRFIPCLLAALFLGCSGRLHIESKSEPLPATSSAPRYKVTVYSGGSVVRTIYAGDYDTGGHSDRWDITEAKTGKHFHLTGTVVIEPADKGNGGAP